MLLCDAYPEAFPRRVAAIKVVTVENCGHWDILVDTKAAVVIDWRVLPNRLAPHRAGQRR